MKLYLKQKFFSWKDRAWVKDETGADRYYIEGKVFSIGKKLWIMTPSGEQIAFVRQKIPSFLPRFIVEIGGQEVAQITKKFTLFKPTYVIEGLGWEVQGDFFAHDYTVSEGMRTIIAIHKHWMSWGDSFELDIADGTDEVMALAVVLAIDAVMDAQQAASVSASSSS
ncbi:MAG: LURP-one-related family protein [Clostridia bacterium]|nr:LURP-one-related family protein [Clostridia bacterium]